MPDNKHRIVQILGSKPLKTKEVIKTLFPKPITGQTAANALTDIAALALWGFVIREGPVEEEVLSLTEKGRSMPADEFSIGTHQFSQQRVDDFVKKLAGSLEDCINDPSLQTYARDSDALQFLYCLLESHASVASPRVLDMIEQFNGLSFWEMSNVMYVLQDVLERRLQSASRYWANLARYTESTNEG